MIRNNVHMVRNPKNDRRTLAERGLPSIRELRKRQLDADELIYMGAEAE